MSIRDLKTKQDTTDPDRYRCMKDTFLNKTKYLRRNRQLGVVAYNYFPGTWEAKTEWELEVFWGQYSENLPQKTKQIKYYGQKI